MTRPLPATGLRTLVGQVVFRVADVPVCWEHVVLAARAWGDWAELDAEVREGVACVRHARETEAFPSDDEVEAAAQQFRYAHDLVSAAATQAWLARWGLTAENWMKYVRRTLLRHKWAAELPDLLARYPASARQVDRALKVVGVCSGHLTRFARKLAGRAAIQDRMSEETPAEREAPSPQSRLRGADRRLLGLSVAVYREAMRFLAGLEASFAVFCRQRLTPKAIGELIAARHGDWVRVAGFRAVFPNEVTAREAALCVRADGEDLAEVAARARAALESVRLYLEEADPVLHGLLLSAREGEVLGPVPHGNQFWLFRVTTKLLPSAADPEVRGRAEQVLVARAIEPEVAARVRWYGDG